MNNNLKRIQEIELEILDEILRVCDKHNLKVVLVGGSCIGAVRHNGMIPWDDDIDLGMTREDYDKFCEVCKNELGDDYFLQNFDTDKKCGLIFAKVRRNDTILSENYCYKVDMHQGVWVDIFPYDNVSNDSKNRKKCVTKIQFYRNLYIIKCGYSFPKGKSPILKFAYYVAKIMSKLFSFRYLIKKLKIIMTKYNHEKTNYIYPYAGAYRTKDLMDSQIMKEFITVNFEGRKCLIYADYDKYLSSLYGDYMTLPPLEERNGGSHTIKEFKDYN